MPRPPTIWTSYFGMSHFETCEARCFAGGFVSATDYQINFIFVYHSYDLFVFQLSVDKEGVFCGANYLFGFPEDLHGPKSMLSCPSSCMILK